VLTVYEKPTCSTCRRLVEMLEERETEFERVDYHRHPLSPERIRALLAKAELRPREVLRTREPLYSELGLDSGHRSDDELVALMAEHPQLLQRPLVERDERALLARPPERVLELL
jgi:arsenate reductase